MKVYNVTIEEWSEANKDYIEFQRQYLGETQDEAIIEAEKYNPGAAILSITEIGEAEKV